MDDFKKNNVNEFTAYDLNTNCVIIKSKLKKKLKKLLNKKSRCKLKFELLKDENAC